MYEPKPIDTSGIELPPELLHLVEQLSEHVHDVWSQQRISDGWTWGPHRDDVKKEHPGLVPYGQLSETEREYDRNTAKQSLKAILSMGWQLQPAAPVPAGASASAAQLSAADVQMPRDLAGLMAIWGERLGGRYLFDAAFVATVAKRILSIGEPLLAYDLLAQGIKGWPHDARLQQLRALALARSGSTLRANQVLQDLLRSGNRENETLSLLGRTHKDLAAQATEGPARQTQWTLAFDFYSQAYQAARDAGNRQDAYYAGINAASLALLRGEAQQSRTLAGEVDAICRELLKSAGGEDYWLEATLGEAALLRGELNEAQDWYTRAARSGAGQYADLSSTRKQARLLLGQLNRDPALADAWLHIPRVICFSGHMIDVPGRPRPRFPADREKEVAAQIRQRLSELDAGFGYASAACGADILFLEAMLERKAEINVILPFKAEAFARESVEIIPGTDWGRRYRAVLEQARSRILEVNQHFVPDSTLSLEYANRLQLGMASLKARTLGTELISLAVWDGMQGDGPGGTASMVEMGRQRGTRVEVISLQASPSDVAAKASPAADSQTAKPEEAGERRVPQELVAILFADAVHFSKLTEEQLPKFVRYYLGAIAELKKRAAPSPLIANTWGDGLFMIFGSVRDAGLFGLQLCEYIQATRWEEIGLPPTMNIRIGLHAGPVYRLMREPVTQRLNYIGAHISQAARIEPITPPGNVYASRAFAALAEAEGIWEFTHEYVGVVPLAKGYGEFPMYHVRRSGATA